MTADEFRARYALLDQVAEGGVRTFHAITPTGGVALVHFVDGGVTPENLALLSQLERLQPERRAHVREVTAVDGGITVVTDLLPGFRSLAAWLRGETADSVASSPAATEPSGAAPAPPAPAQAPPHLSAEPPAAAPASIETRWSADQAPASADGEAAASPAAEGTGSAPAAPASADFPAAPSALASPEPESSAPPAFDFAASASAEPETSAPAFASSDGTPESVPESAAVPAEPAREPGEFTKLFQAAELRAAAAGSSTFPAEPAAEPLPPSAAAPPTAPGEPQSAIYAAPPAPPVEPEPTFAAAPSAPHAEPEPASASAPEPAAAPADEPGEFTRLFRAEMLRDALAKAGHGSEAPAPPPPPPLAAAPPPPAVEPPAFASPPVEPPAFRPAAFESPPAQAAPPAPLGSETSALFQALSGPAPTAPAEPSDLGFARPPAPADRSFARPPEPADLSFELPPPAPRSPGAPADASATSSFAAPFREPSAGAGDAAPASGTPGGEFSRLFQRMDLPAWAVPPHGRPASPGADPFPPADPFPAPRPAAPEPFARGAAGKADDDYLEKLYTPSQSSLGDPDPLPRHDDAPSSLGMAVPAFSPQTPPSFSTPVPPPPAPAPFPPPRPQPAAAPPASTTPLVIGIVVVVVLALALVLYFVLR